MSEVDVRPNVGFSTEGTWRDSDGKQIDKRIFGKFF